MTAPIRQPLPIAELLGFRVEVDSDAGQAHCLIEMRDVHRNRHGVLHGGIISTLLDTASGVTASMTVDDLGLAPFSTVSLNVNFLAPATGGDLCATGRVTGGGRSLVFVDADLRDADGTVIATSTGVFKRVRQAGDKP